MGRLRPRRLLIGIVKVSSSEVRGRERDERSDFTRGSLPCAGNANRWLEHMVRPGAARPPRQRH